MAGGDFPQLAVELAAKDYPSADGRHAVLARIDFQTGGAGRVAIVGNSGSGKSTFLNLICGLDTDCSGFRVGLTNAARFAADYTMVTQHRDLLDWLTVFENVEFGASGNDAALGRIESILQQLKLAELADRYPSNLSGGERTRVAIARAIVADPAVLLLDEPFTGLDEAARWEIFDDLCALQTSRGFLALLVTHDLEEAVAFSEALYILEGRPGSLREASSIRPMLPIGRGAFGFRDVVGNLRQEILG